MEKLFHKSFLVVMALAAIGLTSCGDDDESPIVPNAGELSGGPFTFIVDGVADNVSGITLNDANVVGTNSSYIVTDDAGNILGLPGTLEALEGVNFDDAGVGICLIWYIRYENDLTGLDVGMNTSGLSGTFDLSNSLTVNRVTLNGATLTGGPFNFIVDDKVDNVSGITVDEAAVNGMNTGFIITDQDGSILGLPPTLTDLEGVDFNGAGPGVCFIYHITYQDDLQGLVAGMNINNLDMNASNISNPITVNRLDAPTLSGGPFTFIVDGTADNLAEGDITVEGGFAISDELSSWIVTDDVGNILALPPSFTAPDFDDAGEGVCLIWYITYAEGLTGLAANNNVNDLDGIFEISNSVTINRVIAPEISGGPFNFIVDGAADNIPMNGITVDNSGSDLGQSGWVVTDDQGTILGLPPSFTAPNFDDAGPGVCLVWYITYEDGLMGLENGMNANDLTGVFALSNPVTVNRLDAPTLSGGPFTFTVGDGMADNLAEGDITVEGGFAISDELSSWIVTDEAGTILGLPPSFTAPDFDDAGEGVCLIWYITYAEGLTGLAENNNVSGLNGTFEISNSVTVNRVLAPEISGGPFNFIVDGAADNIPMNGITVDNSGSDLGESGWVVTDDQGTILGLPPSFTAPNFDDAGPGVCLVWYITYEDGLMGLENGMNANDLNGVFALSNPVTVNRLDAPTLSGGPFTFTVGDGTADNIEVGAITVEGGFSVNDQSSWVVTDDLGNILGLPASFTDVDFDGTPAGVCLIWYITYAEGLTGLEMGNNVSGLDGAVFELSNSITVNREE